MMLLNTVKSNLPLGIIMLIVAVAIIALTIIIKQLTRKKYIKELELSKVLCLELEETLYSDDWNLLISTVTSDSMIKQRVYEERLFETFDSIDEVIKKAKNIVLSMNEESLKESTSKELGFLLSYVKGVIKSERTRIDTLNTTVKDLLIISKGVKQQENTNRKEETVVVKLPVGREVKNFNTIEEKENTIKEKQMNNEANLEREEVAGKEAEISYFAKGLVIEGDVLIDTDLELKGEIKGNLTCKGAVVISDEAIVNGNLNADHLNLVSGKIIGDVKISTDIVMGNDTYIKGDVYANALEINGSVEGNIQASADASLLENAKVLGNVSATYIYMEKGAKISGAMSVGENVSKETA